MVEALPWLEGYLAARGAEGQTGQVTVVPTAGGLSFDAVAVVGMGEEIDTEGLRRAAGWLARRTSGEVATTLHLVDVEEATSAVVEGFALGSYRFTRWKSESGSEPRTLRLLDGYQQEQASRALILAEAVAFARDLVNEPAAAKPPAVLAEAARRLPDSVEVKILDPSQLDEAEWAGLLAVSAGAANPPRLVELRYRPDPAEAALALVGKGVVFDSGGLSIKPAEAMEPMKSDMAGAATVMAAVDAIARLRLPVAVSAWLPLTENMPDGAALRPGDVIRYRTGTTVEVVNTDAEGRLILADGLAAAVAESPDLVVDVATLTGACKVALGEKVAGLWANREEAAEALLAAGERAGEALWRMPLVGEYRSKLDSDTADLKNTGGRFGGAVTAALFLAEFVGDLAWAHLDIAGPARWPDEEHYQSRGGSGFGVRTLVALAEGMAGGPQA